MKLAERLAAPNAQGTICQRAALLCKADLLTGIVGEFPTLQGIMGGEYARHDGESSEVSRAIAEHYLPKTMEDGLPESAAGRILSLADRLDTIVAFFYVGVVPTGSEGPIGSPSPCLGRCTPHHRRASSRQSGRHDSNAKDLIAQQEFRAHGSADPLEFITDRLRYYVRVVHGFETM